MSKIKVLVGLYFPEVSLLDLQRATFSLCPPMTFPAYAHTLDISFSSYKDTSPMD